jgi:hypothetical protein
MINQHEPMALLHIDQTPGVYNAHTHIRNDTVIIKAVDQHVLVCKRRPTSVKDGCSTIMEIFGQPMVKFVQLQIDSVIRACSLLLSLTDCMSKTVCRPITHIDQHHYFSQ